MQNAVLKNRPQQPAHARLTVVNSELQCEDDNAGGGDKVCNSASVWISVRGSTIATSELDV